MESRRSSNARLQRALCTLLFLVAVAFFLLSFTAIDIPKVSSLPRRRVDQVPFADNALSAHLPADDRVTSPAPENDVLVVYVYYDGVQSEEDRRASKGAFDTGKQEENPTQSENLKFFLHHGLQSNADYLLVFNSPVPKDANVPTKLPNVFTWTKPNECYDLGSFSAGVDRMKSEYGRAYKKYILVNASVRGPFIPTYSTQCWTDIFLAPLSDKTKMVGISFNCDPNHPRHVQSMVLAFDQIGFDTAVGPVGCPKTLDEAIVGGETQLTKRLVDRGYQAAALMTAFKGEKDYAHTCTHLDPAWKNQYFGMSFHPYEVVFLKANRHIDDHALAQYTKWHDNMPSTCEYHIQ
ncbi:uncharacterized protein EV422DRAFT_366672 [Fimicolochytrium jonesii]|uniref:uncharacterized protein n=1 Tax=Fimicolochytrium jonesii TaxID=1396493 RepID=UPI0022FDCC30|nr:uncharacterized protein EV422DRAFT_366672 [Fimicolochytrium jonesii]KAI8823704.1 hypothetical protein EV422DRAFT_366672 [Fimicolochytrium jonesii]